VADVVRALVNDYRNHVRIVERIRAAARVHATAIHSILATTIEKAASPCKTIYERGQCILGASPSPCRYNGSATIEVQATAARATCTSVTGAAESNPTCTRNFTRAEHPTAT
jgi:hypothetical protein